MQTVGRFNARHKVLALLLDPLFHSFASHPKVSQGRQRETSQLSPTLPITDSQTCENTETEKSALEIREEKLLLVNFYGRTCNKPLTINAALTFS